VAGASAAGAPGVGATGRASITPGVSSTAKLGLVLLSLNAIQPWRPSDSATRYQLPRRAFASTRVPFCSSASTVARGVGSANTVTLSA
jgi:hypothetical protein